LSVVGQKGRAPVSVIRKGWSDHRIIKALGTSVSMIYQVTHVGESEANIDGMQSSALLKWAAERCHLRQILSGK
jgi:hypothetical protein